MHQAASSPSCSAAVPGNHSIRRRCCRCKYRLRSSQAMTCLLLLLTNSSTRRRCSAFQAARSCTWLTMRLSNGYCRSGFSGSNRPGRQQGHTHCVKALAVCCGPETRPLTTLHLADPLPAKWKTAREAVWRPRNSAESDPAEAVRWHPPLANLTDADRSAQTAHQHLLRQPQQGTLYPAFARLSHRAVAPATGLCEGHEI